MNKKFFLPILLILFGVAILIYNRILFDQINLYSNLIDYQLIGLVLGILIFGYSIFKQGKIKFNGVLIGFLILLDLSLIALHFIAKSEINNYPKLF
tara:strand:- start:3370 stop:3657 length:288 start_codon:yes stop_codon:yes gene_type:complete